MKRQAAAAVALCLGAAFSFAASASFEKGEAAFVANKPRRPPLLEGALADDPSNETVYLYLGIVYQQLGDPEKAIATLRRGAGSPRTHKDLLYYNMGNNFFGRKEYTAAEEMYSSALAANARLAEASLEPGEHQARAEVFRGRPSPTTPFSSSCGPQTRSARRSRKCSGACARRWTSRPALPRRRPARQAALMNEVMNALNNAGAQNITVESVGSARTRRTSTSRL